MSEELERWRGNVEAELNATDRRISDNAEQLRSEREKAREAMELRLSNLNEFRRTVELLLKDVSSRFTEYMPREEYQTRHQALTDHAGSEIDRVEAAMNRLHEEIVEARVQRDASHRVLNRTLVIIPILVAIAVVLIDHIAIT